MHFYLSFILTIVLSQSFAQSGDIGAAFPLNDAQCLLNEHREAIRHILSEKSNQYKHVINRNTTTRTTSLIWPVKQSENFDHWGATGISNFVDLNNEFPGSLLDYNCGTRTYDTESGYNHQGVDIFSWPFSWKKMDNDHVEIIAAADGIIIYKEGNNEDKSCSFNSRRWNAVYVQHLDGSIAWYGHLKTNGLTTLEEGDEIKAGDFVGIMGSSGNSTGPHLHFELYNSEGNLVDPFVGECNTTTDQSWWANQIDYETPTINTLHTHNSPPSFGCYEDERANIAINFAPGNTVFFATYFRDQQAFSTSYHQVYRPDGSLFQSWETEPDIYYSASYWYRSFTIPTDEIEGKWTFEVSYFDKTYRHYFYLNGTTPDNNLTISTDTLFFMDIPAGTVESKSVTISNTGRDGAYIDYIELPEGFSGRWYGQIDDESSKDITITFNPEYDDVFIGKMKFITDAKGTHEIVLKGTTGVKIERSIDGLMNLAFGEVALNETKNMELNLSNQGNSKLEISDITYPVGFSGPSQLSILPLGEQILNIFFSPSAETEYSGDLEIISNATQPVPLVTLSGSGISVLNSQKLIKTTIYPNPTVDGNVQITGLDQFHHMKVLTVSGKIIYTGKPKSNISLRTNGYGIYLIQLSNSKDMKALSLVYPPN